MKVRMLKTIYPANKLLNREKGNIAWRRKVYTAEISKYGSVYVHLANWMMCVEADDIEIIEGGLNHD